MCVWVLASLGGCAHKPEVVPVSQPLPKHAHSCESARFLFEPDQVLATGANLLVTGNEINEEIADAADQAWRSYCRKIQQLRQEALDTRVKIKVIETYAKNENLNLEQWLEKTQAEAPEPTSEEVRAFYDKEIPNGEPSFEEVQGEVQNYLLQKSKQKYLLNKVNTLMAEAGITISMPDVSPAPIDIKRPSYAPVLGDVSTKVTVTVFLISNALTAHKSLTY